MQYSNANEDAMSKYIRIGIAMFLLILGVFLAMVAIQVVLVLAGIDTFGG